MKLFPRVLIVHNRYKFRGGEDVVVEMEAELLRSRGHEVLLYERSNEEMDAWPAGRKALLPLLSVWSPEAVRDLRAVLADFRPDVVHVHNVFTLISPAVYAVCAQMRVPVVQTLHNFRLLCPGAMLFRDGKPCEDCLHSRFAWRGIWHRCYRGSLGASAAVAGSVCWHGLRGTWRSVSAYICLTEFQRRKFIAAGWPAEKLVVKPNFVHPDPGPRPPGEKGGYFLFVGRLSPEKGVDVLLRAWERPELAGVPLKVCGDGPLAEPVAAATRQGLVEHLGALPRQKVHRLMCGARALVLPTLWYEGFPMVIAEAFAAGLPVIASDLGAAAELVGDGRNGLQFRPRDPGHLAAKVRFAWDHTDEMSAMGRAARLDYENLFTAEPNYKRLMAIYDRAMGKEAERFAGVIS